VFNLVSFGATKAFQDEFILVLVKQQGQCYKYNGPFFLKRNSRSLIHQPSHSFLTKLMQQIGGAV
jgi:hypothetical protein